MRLPEIALYLTQASAMQADQSPLISTFCLVTGLIPAFTDSLLAPDLLAALKVQKWEPKDKFWRKV